MQVDEVGRVRTERRSRGVEIDTQTGEYEAPTAEGGSMRRLHVEEWRLWWNACLRLVERKRLPA